MRAKQHFRRPASEIQLPIGMDVDEDDVDDDDNGVEDDKGDGDGERRKLKRRKIPPLWPPPEFKIGAFSLTASSVS